MTSYLIFAAIAVSTSLGGLAWLQTTRLDTAQTELALARAELQTCGGRLDAVLRDVRSDNEIDALPDSALRDVPSHWLLPHDEPASP